MGEPMLRVDVDVLDALSTTLFDAAIVVGDLDPVTATACAATGMPESAVGPAAAETGWAIARAFALISGNFTTVSEAAASSARDYDIVETEFRNLLAGLSGRA